MRKINSWLWPGLILTLCLAWCLPHADPAEAARKQQAGRKNRQHRIRGRALAEAGHLERVRTAMQKEFSPYMRAQRNFKVVIKPFTSQALETGRFESVRIQTSDGELGYFQEHAFGLPFKMIDVTIRQLEVNPQKLQAGQWEAWQAEEIRINKFEVDEKEINRNLANQSGHLKKMRVHFKDGFIHLQWAGKIKAGADFLLTIAPDPRAKKSDNLWFKTRRSVLAGIPLPGKLLDWLAREYNPVLRLQGLQARLCLGKLEIKAGKLRLISSQATK